MEENRYHDIILNEDVEKLHALSDDEKEELMSELVYEYLPTKSLKEMNEVQKTLYLAWTLEDACQADSLLSLSEEEELFLALPETKKALEALGAFQSAALLSEFIALLPVGSIPEWDWFFEEEREDIIERIDGGLCDYPDGVMCDFYITYLSKPENARQLLLGLGRQNAAEAEAKDE